MAVNNLNTPGVGIQPSIVDAKGDLLVGTAADAIDRLGVTGTTGSVLTADAGETTGLKWAAAGSVGGLVHIETQAVSGVAAVNFNDVFSADFTNYLMVGSWTMSGVGDIGVRLRAGGTDLTSSSYRWNRIYGGVTVADLFTSQVNQTNTTWNVGRGDLRSGYVMYFYSPFLAQHTAWHSQQSSNYFTYSTGRVENTTSYDGFTLTGGGDYTGTISVFGYKG
jgi:hypothetical protein